MLIERDYCHCDKVDKCFDKKQACRLNHCKHFDFNKMDVFDLEHIYKPRNTHSKRVEHQKEMNIFEEVKGGK